MTKRCETLDTKFISPPQTAHSKLPVCLTINMKPQHSNKTAMEGGSSHLQQGLHPAQEIKRIFAVFITPGLTRGEHVIFYQPVLEMHSCNGGEEKYSPN